MKFLITLFLIVSIPLANAEVKTQKVFGGELHGEALVLNPEYFVVIKRTYIEMAEKYYVKRIICNQSQECFPLNAVLKYEDVFADSNIVEYHSSYNLSGGTTLSFTSEYMVSESQLEERKEALSARRRPLNNSDFKTVNKISVGLAVFAGVVVWIPHPIAKMVAGVAAFAGGSQQLKKGHTLLITEEAASINNNIMEARQEVTNVFFPQTNEEEIMLLKLNLKNIFETAKANFLER